MKRHALLSIFIAALLTGCGGGGGGGGGTLPSGGGIPTPTPTPTPVPTSGTNYSFFTSAPSTVVGAIPGLFAYDPDTGNITQVPTTVGVDQRQAVYANTFDSSTDTVSDIHPAGVLYTDNGYFKYVSAAKSAGLTPVQLSTYHYSGVICHSQLTDNYYYFQDSGTDSTCGNANDSAYHAVDTTMTATDTAYTLPGVPLVALTSQTTDTVNYVLTNNAGNLTRINQDGSNPTIVQGSVTTVTVMDEMGDTVLLDIGGTVAIYDAANNLLSSPLYTLTNDIQQTAINDGSNFYFFDGATLYAVNTNGATAAVKVGTDAIGLSTGQYFSPYLVNSAGLAYTSHAPNGAGVYAISVMNLTTGSNSEIIAPGNDSISIVGSNGTKIYLNDENGNAYDAQQVDMASISADGPVIPDANWVGYQYASASSGNTVPLQSLILDQFTYTNLKPSGGTLSVYDAASNTLTYTVANLSDGIFFGYGFGNPIYGTVASSKGTQFASIDTSQGNALRILDTSTNVMDLALP